MVCYQKPSSIKTILDQLMHACIAAANGFLPLDIASVISKPHKDFNTLVPEPCLCVYQVYQETRLIDQIPKRSDIRNNHTMNRALSIRSNKSSSGNAGGSGRKAFSFSSLRGNMQPELSRKLYRLIKSDNNLINAHEAAGKERVAIATQLSEWGEQTGDESLSDISDKVGVVLSELGEQEDSYAHALDESRAVLKQIRNTEKSVQPSRDGKAKIADEIAKLKSKEPESARLVVLEQELVRAEAENLVAEAQLTNVTRQKLKEAYDAEFLATIERAEKQIILARHGRRLLQLLDDTPVVPGDTRPSYVHGAQARQILNDAEDDLRDWRPEADNIDADSSVKSPVQSIEAGTTNVGTAATTEGGGATKEVRFQWKIQFVLLFNYT
ncbi:putative sphingolipid long chain base-responsive protein lsp1 protein [Phaeoacremonium minimum UCRPA7]|uniref:Putative sphingolipid long chain base-responsive protein lsp1 protein n=1 Tax=Phaeoacremonium minimum (strain UCR-PA7) TaxID=1286976 RepID=R8BV64_PHAM7|nr:putative sphingolipid long chain base-responsive protein lsp1 protein [Phaeoacremonium minimum UCRPA7]EOO03247.1 putative sphingolipid long chain base-responsive protein lsp1 protein [Phaeoacremonium minimum UCRPA7]